MSVVTAPPVWNFSAGTAKICSGCHRRAYCSKECQHFDWNQGIGRQGHENWCGLNTGEEDIDWELKPNDGTGLELSLSALFRRNLVSWWRRFRRFNHPAVKDLPLISVPFLQNPIPNLITIEPGKVALFLRIARLSHACDPNSTPTRDHTCNVGILLAQRDIQPGEEITYSYILIDDLNELLLSMEGRRSILADRFGITCTDDCFCHNEQKLALIQECNRLNNEILVAQSKVGNVDGSWKCGNVDGITDTVCTILIL